MESVTAVPGRVIAGDKVVEEDDIILCGRVCGDDVVTVTSDGIISVNGCESGLGFAVRSAYVIDSNSIAVATHDKLFHMSDALRELKLSRMLHKYEPPRHFSHSFSTLFSILNKTLLVHELEQNTFNHHDLKLPANPLSMMAFNHSEEGCNIAFLSTNICIYTITHGQSSPMCSIDIPVSMTSLIVIQSEDNDVIHTLSSNHIYTYQLSRQNISTGNRWISSLPFQPIAALSLCSYRNNVIATSKNSLFVRESDPIEPLLSAIHPPSPSIPILALSPDHILPKTFNLDKNEIIHLCKLQAYITKHIAFHPTISHVDALSHVHLDDQIANLFEKMLPNSSESSAHISAINALANDIQNIEQTVESILMILAQQPKHHFEFTLTNLTSKIVSSCASEIVQARFKYLNHLIATLIVLYNITPNNSQDGLVSRNILVKCIRFHSSYAILDFLAKQEIKVTVQIESFSDTSSMSDSEHIIERQESIPLFLYLIKNQFPIYAPSDASIPSQKSITLLAIDFISSLNLLPQASSEQSVSANSSLAHLLRDLYLNEHFHLVRKTLETFTIHELSPSLIYLLASVAIDTKNYDRSLDLFVKAIGGIHSSETSADSSIVSDLHIVVPPPPATAGAPIDMNLYRHHYFTHVASLYHDCNVYSFAATFSRFAFNAISRYADQQQSISPEILSAARLSLLSLFNASMETNAFDEAYHVIQTCMSPFPQSSQSVHSICDLKTQRNMIRRFVASIIDHDKSVSRLCPAPGTPGYHFGTLSSEIQDTLDFKSRTTDTRSLIQSILSDNDDDDGVPNYDMMCYAYHVWTGQYLHASKSAYRLATRLGLPPIPASPTTAASNPPLSYGTLDTIYQYISSRRDKLDIMHRVMMEQTKWCLVSLHTLMMLDPQYAWFEVTVPTLSHHNDDDEDTLTDPSTTSRIVTIQTLHAQYTVSVATLHLVPNYPSLLSPPYTTTPRDIISMLTQSRMIRDAITVSRCLGYDTKPLIPRLITMLDTGDHIDMDTDYDKVTMFMRDTDPRYMVPLKRVLEYLDTDAVTPVHHVQALDTLLHRSPNMVIPTWIMTRVTMTPSGVHDTVRVCLKNSAVMTSCQVLYGYMKRVCNETGMGGSKNVGYVSPTLVDHVMQALKLVMEICRGKGDRDGMMKTAVEWESRLRDTMNAYYVKMDRDTNLMKMMSR